MQRLLRQKKPKRMRPWYNDRGNNRVITRLLRNPAGEKETTV